MNRFTFPSAFSLCLLAITSVATAGEVSTNATATSNRFGPGTASANAGYVGSGQGFAHTDTRTGDVNLAQGLAFGVDANGIHLSSSLAVATRFLPAAASNFNLSIGTNGSVAASNGFSVANGGSTRSVTAGGFARNMGGNGVSGSTVGARTSHGGTTIGRTWSHSTPARIFRR